MTTPSRGDTEFASPKERFLGLLQEAWQEQSFLRLTLGGPIGPDRTLRRLLIRPVVLKQGPRLSFVFRHDTKDITKNLTEEEGLHQLEALIEFGFRTAHLSTRTRTADLEFRRGQPTRLRLGRPNLAESVVPADGSPPALQHDRPRQHLLSVDQAPWLQELGVTTSDGRVMRGMEAKFRQIQKFLELLQHLAGEGHLLRTGAPAETGAGPTDSQAAAGTGARTGSGVPLSLPLSLVDMGCGKGYLTFAAHAFLQSRAPGRVQTVGIETRPELVRMCQDTARKHRMDGLHFRTGEIATTPLEQVDILVALHACDTATDDALARGIHAGASLLLVSPCCHKELRPQIHAPPVLRPALKHGIFLTREAEFVTDALRAALLDRAGYDTRVFEFISTEHTGKNLMIAGLKRRIAGPTAEPERQIRELAAFYGIRSHRLAQHLGLGL